MAETKTRAPSGRGKAKTRTTKRKPAKARKSSAAKSSNGASASRRASKTRSSSKSKNGAGRVDAARNAAEETAKQAGHSVGDAASSVGRVASKAKTPLLAGGAAVAGVAGGLALGARQARHSKVLPRRPKVKIDSGDLAKAAKEVGQFGVDVGQLASELRRNREAANGAKRRSPIEVVLQGLTNRGQDSS
jgi:hypothetical protein